MRHVSRPLQPPALSCGVIVGMPESYDTSREQARAGTRKAIVCPHKPSAQAGGTFFGPWATRKV